jgi:hypothetical protein
MRRLTSILSVSLLGVSAALAQQDMVSFSGEGADQKANINYTFGYEFAVNSPVTVAGLSAFADGVGAGGTVVGLWNSSGTEIATASVGASAPLTADGLFRYSLLGSSLTLQDGDYFVGALVPQGADYSHGVTGLSSIPQITFVSSVFTPGSTLTDPGAVIGGQNYVFGGNVVVASGVARPLDDPVPDAGSSMMLLSAGLAGLAAFGRKKLL